MWYGYARYVCWVFDVGRWVACIAVLSLLPLSLVRGAIEFFADSPGQYRPYTQVVRDFLYALFGGGAGIMVIAWFILHVLLSWKEASKPTDAGRKPTKWLDRPFASPFTNWTALIAALIFFGALPIGALTIMTLGEDGIIVAIWVVACGLLGGLGLLGLTFLFDYFIEQAQKAKAHKQKSE